MKTGLPSRVTFRLPSPDGTLELPFTPASRLPMFVLRKTSWAHHCPPKWSAFADHTSTLR